MEPDCTSPASWDGPVGAVLGTQLYIDCTGDSDKDYQKALDEIEACFRTLSKGKQVKLSEEKQEEEGELQQEPGEPDKSSPKKLLIVSSPESGPDGQGPDGKTKYTFPVMEQIAALAKKEDGVLVAYDWAGSSNAFNEDNPIWEELGKAASFEEKAVLVKKTKWFAASNRFFASSQSPFSRCCFPASYKVHACISCSFLRRSFEMESRRPSNASLK